MKTAIYVRVSTDEQAEEGYSIEAQKRRLLAYIESQDWTLFDIFIDDGYSAKDLERPEMKRLLHCISENMIDVVLVYRLDRLTRSASDCDKLLKLFEEHSVKFQSSTESFETRTAAGRLFIRLIADIAQWERETIAERVRFGMEQKVREGKRPGAKFPYGYDKKGIQVVEEVKIIKRLRYMYMVERLSYKKIAEQLYIEGVDRRGYAWTAYTVQLTLENPFYAGIIRFGSKLPNGKYTQRNVEERVECVYGDSQYEAIWTIEEFKEHTERMKSRSSNGYSRKLDYWFTGLLRCGRCGAAMFGRLTTKRSLKDGTIVRNPYYWCSNRKSNNSCDMPMFRQSHVEHLIMEHINKIVFDQELMESGHHDFEEEAKKNSKEIAKIKRKLDEFSKRKKKWQYMFVEDLITFEELRERLKEEDENTEIESKKLNSLNVDSGFIIDTPRLIRLRDAWNFADDSEKQELLRTIFNTITLKTECRNVKGVKNKFFDAEIEVKYN
ncbi:recombinase family protein [Paenibacillus alvei]|uniref:recombinase family protein n=1 Tax=Paenibacillus alvei TaxID=44250 RepID=UPI0002898667|nr:recombinase family protein [Paenibacillus alvei]EJW19942.1 site-specific recombinase for integration and excision [Paenibacillus alvei DSM 29]MCY9540432.1 recombinase family protein [Paenibacillus alvei]MCY9705569.1 recombinase family protein [Paenibacillus alvei]MCY9738043.1 recombinase family protein [Paenibacillus alvei]MCY9757099.1 recombinase family protein [Paenibacillus alvei]